MESENNFGGFGQFVVRMLEGLAWIYRHWENNKES